MTLVVLPGGTLRPVPRGAFLFTCSPLLTRVGEFAALGVRRRGFAPTGAFSFDRSSNENGRSCFEINDDCGNKSCKTRQPPRGGEHRIPDGQSSPFMATARCGESDLIARAFFEQRSGATLIFFVSSGLMNKNQFLTSRKA